jgi:hypothetical protein
MYVLKQDAKAYDTGATIPKGTALFSVYNNISGDGGILAMARLAGERHKLSLPKDAIEWANEPRCGN